MDKSLLEYLHNNGISYIVHVHPAVFTVKEHSALIGAENFFHTKNLFLKDENNKFYLVCMDAHKRLNMNQLKDYFHVKSMTFASERELKEKLTLAAGSVSVFGMIYAKDVILIMDEKLMNADSSGFHPNINTATLEISREDLAKFVRSLNCEVRIISLE